MGKDDGEFAEHDDVINAHLRIFLEGGNLFDWGRVAPAHLLDCLERLSGAGLSITFMSYLAGRAVTVRIHDRDGQDTHHCVSGEELDVLMAGLSSPDGPAWSRRRFTPHPRGSRRR